MPFRKYEEHHYKNVEDVSVAFNSDRVWVCLNGVALFMAKIIPDGTLYAEFGDHECLAPPEE